MTILRMLKRALERQRMKFQTNMSSFTHNPRRDSCDAMKDGIQPPNSENTLFIFRILSCKLSSYDDTQKSAKQPVLDLDTSSSAT